MTRIQVADDKLAYEFDGELLAGPVTTAFGRDGEQRPRWYEAVLYAVDAGEFAYVLAQSNPSLVWHQAGALADSRHVRQPGKTRFGDLPADAFYCGTIRARGARSCPPAGPDDFSDREFVVTELPQRKVFRARDYPDLIRQIATSGGDGESYVLSAPIRELLRQAAYTDPAFEMDAAGDKPVIQL